MIRIAGVDLPDTKSIEIALTYIYGIGRTRSKEILNLLKINPETKTKFLTDKDISQLRELIEKSYTTESDLKRLVSLNIKRLVEINCYRGRRHIQGLPLRGQRTKTNAQTRKKTASKQSGRRYK
uniref:Small ribosomal subunit protein uS13c n=3 Tax=Vischeria TaxID=44431 RepID=A0A5P8SZH7_9STRA|nr:ribosomal protein S13 [Vischeria sp. ACOI 3415]AOW70841.1 ribosomal protein S13 [Vischeria sp. CAUP Q 202]QAA12087.1 ribosomal protein S13 [Vischeria sp. ACOI 3415]QFR99650.1 ribosomal protein S13 [Vischeria stellata]